jgi:hypothetical protein
MEDLIISQKEIENRIVILRSEQVMIDSDLAEYYGVETKRLNEQVKRNKERFPKEFCFQLNENEFELLRSQNVTSEKSDLRSQNATSENNELRSQIVTLNKKGGRRYLPYVFTEQGVAMLSAVLKSETAVKVSIQIMNAFVGMRRFLVSNADVFRRIDTLELNQDMFKLDSDKKFDEIFIALDKGALPPKQGIFYDGQIFDAYTLISDIIRSAKSSIIIIDNYADDTVLQMLTKRLKAVRTVIYTQFITKTLAQDLKKHNRQYEPIEIIELKSSHDRFMIIDNKEVYHFGASLKDAGKKWFAFSLLEIDANDILSKLYKNTMIKIMTKPGYKHTELDLFAKYYIIYFFVLCDRFNYFEIFTINNRFYLINSNKYNIFVLTYSASLSMMLKSPSFFILYL